MAALYKLSMGGIDLVGAYLITLANPDLQLKAIDNLYGFPPAGQNFPKEFDKCLFESGYKNASWDLKFFFKWV